MLEQIQKYNHIQDHLILKILGTGELKKNIEITAHFASKNAQVKIEKAGGKLSIVKK